MTALPPLSRRTLLAAFAATFAAATAPALAHWTPPSPARLAQLDVYDRVSGRSLSVYEKDGQQYIVGAPGHEYALRIRNLTSRRILAVTSVDGVNVISGDAASPEQSGYVIEPWGSVEIAGWRKSTSETAAFYFTEHANSYAARTGRPFDVGVIGIAVFAERPQRVAQRIAEAPRAQKDEASAETPASPPLAGAGASASDARRDESDVRERAAAPQPMAKLGTGHGRHETSYVRQVNFERATSSPAQLVAIRYDRYESLVAMGVLPGSPPIADRTPRPFPGLRFAPDPR